MKGHLRLVCARNTLGHNHLREQSFRAPMHLSKPHEDEDALVVNLVTPTAGVFDDDEIELDIRVEQNSSLVLTTPSSSRIYRSRKGGVGKVRHSLHVAEGGFLEYYPEPFIPHAGARYHQQNNLHIAETGSLLFFEWLSPGRVASGESFQYQELCWDTDLWHGEHLAARERYVINPNTESTASLLMVSPQAHYLGCFIVGPKELPMDDIEALDNENVYIGVGPLETGAWTIKAVCNGSLAARHTLQALRKILYKSLQRVPAHLGRF